MHKPNCPLQGRQRGEPSGDFARIEFLKIEAPFTVVGLSIPVVGRGGDEGLHSCFGDRRA